ncbi:LysR family transcriptional regulator [Roseomonas soli]|uniref:LysR family transcriptional regulator n=1 Tax=Neoroseomonas soli TaxID=1081025 RepID=A0A9X9WSC7_9PROT|nr:LysR family transcriptional regulator [Neoroseomonas soli]
MNLHLLRLFDAVAGRASFSRAAEALHISQPAVSKGVRELEAQLGSPLLERGPGGIRLTEAGRVLAGHARTIFAAEGSAEEELAALRGLTRGVLRIGASTTVATYVLPPLLGAFHRSHPQVELRLTSANTRAIADLLLRRELDLAIVEGPVGDPSLQVTRWREDAMVLIAAPAHRLALRKGPVPITVLAEEILIVREPGSGSGEIVDTALAAKGIVPRQQLEVGSTEAIKQVVMAGVGVALISADAAADQIALGKLRVVRLRDFVLRRDFNRLSVAGRQLSPAAMAFQGLLAARPRAKARAAGLRSDPKG